MYISLLCLLLEHVKCVTGQWTAGSNAGGQVSNSTFHINPQIKIDIPSKKSHYLLEFMLFRQHCDVIHGVWITWGGRVKLEYWNWNALYAKKTMILINPSDLCIIWFVTYRNQWFWEIVRQLKSILRDCTFIVAQVLNKWNCSYWQLPVNLGILLVSNFSRWENCLKTRILFLRYKCNSCVWFSVPHSTFYYFLKQKRSIYIV